MGGKAAEPGEGFIGVFSDSSGDSGLDDSGYVLTYNTTSGEYEKATAGTDPVAGVAATDTVNPLWPGGHPSKFTEYLVDPEIWILTEGTVDVRVDSAASRSTDIKKHDIVALSENTDGVVVHWKDNNACASAFSSAVTSANLAEAWEQIVGIAMEDLSASSEPSDGDSKILVNLRIMGVLS